MNGYTLKLIAIITMFIDHLAAVLISPSTSLYWVCRCIGRLAFPIFCFLLVEGFYHTRNVKKYMARLGLFALISEIPFDLAFADKTLTYGYRLHQNVFFTLFIGLVVIWGMSIINGIFTKNKFSSDFLNRLYQGLVVMIGCFIAYFLKTDYDYMGVFLIVVFYLYRQRKKAVTIGVFLVNLLLGNIIQLLAALAMVFILRYNGEKGPQGNKYAFYIFYPAHILLLYLVSLLPV